MAAFDYKTEFKRYRRYYQSLGDSLNKPVANAYTSAIFSFLVVSLFGWYAIRPTIQTILFLRRQIADDKKVSQQMEDKITHLIELQASLQNVRSDLPVLDEALPENPDPIAVVAEIRNLAAVTDASLSAVTIADTALIGADAPLLEAAQPPDTQKTVPLVPGQNVGVMPITVSVSGSYDMLKAFLNGLLAMRRIVTIDSADILRETAAAGDISANDKPLRLVLKLNTYYRSPSSSP
ncbi:type 4a pilus biogenesis protein PilO [Patescibacteria group bacterium]|nr:type 4a pilus biogenesis protein PilO [Patescibacteria group bacterium]